MVWTGQADSGHHRQGDRASCERLRQAVGGLAGKLTLALGAALTAVATGFGMPAEARTEPEPRVVTLQALSPQARTTYGLIRSGGPFPYDKDGSVFFNRERLLPAKARGYWREYTVPTPGARNRGARRIVCGGAKPTVPDACFYTADHYASFSRIADGDAR